MNIHINKLKNKWNELNKYEKKSCIYTVLFSIFIWIGIFTGFDNPQLAGITFGIGLGYFCPMAYINLRKSLIESE